MTTAQYLAALKKLGLTPYARATAEAIGVSPRMARYYAAGRPVPATVGKLLALMVAARRGRA